jgi:diguanylate cyclase (GGDEF)-like protein
LDDLDDLVSKPIHGGVLFQLFKKYDYIIINHGLKHNGHSVFQFISSMVTELKNRIDIQESYSRLQKKIDDLDKRLIVKENELRLSEKSLKKRVYEIHNLLEISNELYSILNLKRLINSALLIILGQVGCQRAFAILYDSVDRKYSKKFLKGIETKEFENYSINVDDPLIKHFTYNQRPVLVDELHGEKGMASMAKFFKEHNIDVIAPIYNSERVRGILGCGEQLYNQSFDQSENDIFNILVNIISISVFNAQTFEEIRDLALTDAMTNLHNYRYFEDRLKEEINRARRSGSCVSIIMLDIDYFKNYNDTLGHQAGDEALRTLGLILKNTVREEDIVNRYGGEEFCIILPGLGKEVISILGERIREKVAEFPFLKQNVQPGGKLTVSLGGSTFPEDADDFEGLVYKADQALYNSKNSGRNRLTIYNYTN